jgi:hypothetical protein
MGMHAAAEFGQAPQRSSIGSSSTDATCASQFSRHGNEGAESGTAEEIERLAEAGKYVGVLRSTRPVTTNNINVTQLRNLERYLNKINGKSLVMEYAALATPALRTDYATPSTWPPGGRTATRVRPSRWRRTRGDVHRRPPRHRRPGRETPSPPATPSGRTVASREPRAGPPRVCIAGITNVHQGLIRGNPWSCSADIPGFGSVRSPEFSHGRAEDGGQCGGGRNDGLPGPR